MGKRAFFVIGPEGSGTYMLAEAFVAAGCTYCDKDDVGEFLRNNTTPHLLVLRRSLPHGGLWPNVTKIRDILHSWGYEIEMIFIIRDYICCINSVMNRGGAIPSNSIFGGAVEILGTMMKNMGGWLISYEYFVLSEKYRRNIFGAFELPEPTGMEFYDGNTKYFI